VPGTAGFHCSFTLDGNCPQEEPGVGIQSIDLGGPVVPGSPIGVLDLLTIGTDSVEMRATFSQPISAASGDEIFFSMEFEPLFDIRRYRVLYSQDILPNADYVVTSYSCTT